MPSPATSPAASGRREPEPDHEASRKAPDLIQTQERAAHREQGAAYRAWSDHEAGRAPPLQVLAAGGRRPNGGSQLPPVASHSQEKQSPIQPAPIRAEISSRRCASDSAGSVPAQETRMSHLVRTPCSRQYTSFVNPQDPSRGRGTSAPEGERGSLRPTRARLFPLQARETPSVSPQRGTARRSPRRRSPARAAGYAACRGSMTRGSSTAGASPDLARWGKGRQLRRESQRTGNAAPIPAHDLSQTEEPRRTQSMHGSALCILTP